MVILLYKYGMEATMSLPLLPVELQTLAAGLGPACD